MKWSQSKLSHRFSESYGAFLRPCGSIDTDRNIVIEKTDGKIAFEEKSEKTVVRAISEEHGKRIEAELYLTTEELDFPIFNLHMY